jgi:hypothetical protein
MEWQSSLMELESRSVLEVSDRNQIDEGGYTLVGDTREASFELSLYSTVHVQYILYVYVGYTPLIFAIKSSRSNLYFWAQRSMT